ncbi:serine/threonine-protein phosphatase 4 regulatory subunit 3B isoform X2 [Hydra vulgaris]|uniref:Serine/threonine-protein phosphatase 4 regulatory subunit 3B isoform X2 n=1 Tax=Hydra vulgaris TaxID=6087 RepID=A0ABM4CJF5_HYDVU
MSNIRRRVKLYALNENKQWIDRGTGHVSTLFDGVDQRTNNKGIVLIVRSEENGNVLLESRILTDTVYQKQQETLVVWSEANNDFALSFQEKEGCGDIWEKICQVQGFDPSVDITQDVGNMTDSDMPQDDEDGLHVSNNDETFEEVQDFSAIELPSCELSKLEVISELFQSVLPSPIGRDKLAIAIENDSYIKKLIDLFHMCEDLENTEGLHTLFQIFKSLFMLEKNALFEVMFQPDIIMDIVGVLEYDPSRKQPIQHREFLKKTVKFNEVIPITNKELLTKIHTTFRVQYIKDILVPAPSLFDENMSTMNSYLFFNKIDIVNIIQEDPHFLDELFAKLKDDESFDEKRREVVLLLKELCNLSQSMQLENRDSFLQILLDRKLFSILKPLLNLDDQIIQSAVIDIIYCIGDHNPAMIRNYLLSEASIDDEESMLLNVFIVLLCSKSFSSNGIDVTLMHLIKNLLDTDNMGLGPNKMEKAEFLSYFYRHCVHILTAPIFEVTNGNELTGKDDYERAVILDHVIDLLTFCVVHHSHQIRSHILGKDILKRVLVLMQSKHKFLVLAALRFCRKIINLKDELYNRYITVGKLLKPVADAFIKNGERYDMLNSAIIELFEFIRVEDIKTLVTYLVENHYEAFANVNYVGTFQGLKVRYDQDKDREENAFGRDEKVSGIIHSSDGVCKKRDDRVLDEYEENWFDAEDDESNVTTNSEVNNAMKPLNSKLKDVDLLDNIPSLNRPSSPQKLSQNNTKSGPNSPQKNVLSENSRKGSPEVHKSGQKILPDSPRPTSPISHKNLEERFSTNKQLPGLNNKPLMNIKINTGILNSLIENHSNDTNNKSLNDKIDEIKESTSFPPKTNSLLTSLVDYPDDDEDDEINLPDEDVTVSPCKRQRIGST